MQSQMSFFWQFLRQPSMIGAVAPSSRHLGRAMLHRIHFDKASLIVELGPGTGIFTRMILEKLKGNTAFVALEKNPELHANLVRRFPGTAIYNDCATNLRQCIRQHNATHADAIVSGLPWAIFPDQLQDEILAATIEALPQGGHFATFAYIHGLMLPAGVKFRKKIKRHFAKVEISPTIWRNLPPAIVYWCTK